MSVLIAGRHRTGTSMLAGVLHHLGYATGPRAPDAAFAPASNPLGQFEDDDFVQLMNHMMGHWRVPEVWRTQDHHLEVFRELVAEREATHGSRWALKSPQLCVVGTYVIDLLHAPVVFITQRGFDASAASLAKRDGMPLQVATHLQAVYDTHLASLSGVLMDHAIPTYIIRYEEMLERPEFFVDHVIAALGAEPDELARARAVAHVMPELRHH